MLVISELTNLQDLLQQLRVTYQKVVEGEGSALIGAKSIVTTARHFYRNQGQLNVPVGSVFVASCSFLYFLIDIDVWVIYFSFCHFVSHLS